MIRSKIIKNHRKFTIKTINKYLSKNSTFLNIACGGQILSDFIIKKNIKEAWGIDKNIKYKRTPNILNLDVDSSKFPFSNNYFDLVVSIWGVEHFKTTNFLGELKRCLKPGGYFIFITPNIFSPIFLANKLLPFSTLNFLRKNIFKIQGNDPAYYKFNNYFTIKNKSNIHGLKIEKLFFIGPANIVYYYPQNRIIQKGIFLVEHSITNRFMFWLKPTIVGVLKKSVNS